MSLSILLSVVVAFWILFSRHCEITFRISVPPQYQTTQSSFPLSYHTPLEKGRSLKVLLSFVRTQIAVTRKTFVAVIRSVPGCVGVSVAPPLRHPAFRPSLEDPAQPQ